MGGITVRKASAEDAAALLAIYTPYVLRTAVSFEYEPPSAEEFLSRMERTAREGYPFLAAEEDGRIIGYAYAGPFIRRPAYGRCAETTVYIREDRRRRGAGHALYTALEGILAEKGILNLYACVAVSEDAEDPYLTDASVRFHSREGFALAGRFRSCGYKFGRWYDMVWMEKFAGEHLVAPAPPEL